MTSNCVTAPCPHPDCTAVLRVPPELPAGEYSCICRGCTVRIAWATRLHGARAVSATLIVPQEAVR